MEQVIGQIVRLRIYDEEGQTDFLLALSKIVWFLMWIMLPFCVFKFFYDLMGIFEAFIGIFFFLLLFKLFGPGNLVMLDELLSRISPTLRTAIRFGVVHVYDLRVRRSDDGREIACLLRGDLVGGSPMRGDQVQFQGRIQNGAFIVRQGRNLTTGAVLAAGRSYSLHILIITVLLAVFFFCYLWGSFDSWIYDVFIKVIDVFSSSNPEPNGQ